LQASYTLQLIVTGLGDNVAVLPGCRNSCSRTCQLNMVTSIVVESWSSCSFCRPATCGRILFFSSGMRTVPVWTFHSGGRSLGCRSQVSSCWNV